MTAKSSIVVMILAGCNLGPRVDDPPDAPPAPDTTTILPPGTAVPGIDTNAELLLQIRINDGLSDSALMASGGVVTRSTGKTGSTVGPVTVRYWNFGPAPVDTGFAVSAPLYVLGSIENSVFTPLPDHPPLIDTLPGDVRYSALRRVINVPTTALYKGGLITTMTALAEGIANGQLGDPVPDGTWVNMPVVLPGTTLEVGGAVPPLAATKVYGRGYRVDVFVLGTKFGRQPLRNNLIPVGQASGLQSGILSGPPATLPTAIDPQLVFQYSIPAGPPGMTFSYSPLATDVVVRLVTGVAPSAILSDADLYRRSATGSVTAYLVDNVASFTVGTTVNNLQLQFVDGAP